MIIRMRLRAGAAIPGRLSTHPLCPRSPGTGPSEQSTTQQQRRTRLPPVAPTTKSPAQDGISIESHPRSSTEPRNNIVSLGPGANHRARQLGEDRQIGVEPNPIQTPDAERQQCPFVLESSELSLHRAAAPVELARALRLSRNQRMQPVRFDPHGRGLALPGRAAPLRGLTLEVCASEGPRSVVARRRTGAHRSPITR